MNLSEFIDRYKAKSGDMKDEIIGAISTLSAENDLLGVMKRVGILQGVTETIGALENALEGKDEDEDQQG